MYKKKGFILIETVIIMMIIVIIVSLTLKGFKLAINYSKELKANNSVYLVEDLLEYSKFYSYGNKTKLFISIENTKGIYLMKVYDEENKVLREEELEEINFYKFDYLNEINYKKTSLNVTDKGVIDPTTLYIKSTQNERYRISIAVGSNNISIRRD